MAVNTVLKPERELTAEEVAEVLAIESKDICATLFKKWFARKPDGGEPRFYVNNYFRLPTSRFNTKREVWTTIGIYIANLHLIQPNFASLLGYVNKPFTGKEIGRIESILSDALYHDKISTDAMADYYNRLQWLGGDRTISLISPSITTALLREPTEIIERKKQLFEQYKDELRDDNPNNAIVAARIEKELVQMAEEFLHTQDGCENFDSKSKVNVGNHYKNMNIMKGPIKNSYSGGYRVNQSNYNSGITKEEYSSFADSSVLGAYMRAVNTEKGGHMAKQANQGLSGIAAAPKGSDCKTTKYLRVFLHPKSKEEYLNRYIVVDKELIELTQENWSTYENTWVDMRSAMYCLEKEPCFCNICIGNQPYLLGLENFGLAVSRIPNRLLGISMKAFHDATVKSMAIPLDDIFEFT